MQGYLRSLPILLCSFVLFLSACLEKIDLEVEKGYEEALAINGKLVAGEPAFIQVSVERLFDFTASARKRVNVRNVILLDEENCSIELALGGKVDHYQLSIAGDHPDFRVETGKSYKIRINTFDGRTFESEFEEILPVPVPTNLRVDTISQRVYNSRVGLYQDRDFLVAKLNTPIRGPDGRKSRLMWETAPASPNVTDTCNLFNSIILVEPVLLDGNLVTVNEIENFELIRTGLTGSELNNKTCMTLYQQSLNEKAFEYWGFVRDLLQRDGNMFEPYPGELPSNIRNIEDEGDLVFGYFYGTQQDTIEL